MSKRENICLSGNNSTLQPTAQSSEMDYITSLQIAEDTTVAGFFLTVKNHKKVFENLCKCNFRITFADI